MDDVMNDRIDYDYHIEEDSDADWSGDDSSSNEMNRGFEDSFEQLENEVNSARDGMINNEFQEFEMDDKLYMDLDAGGANQKEDGENKEKAESQSQKNNDDLLYDPDLDDEDERWMEKERQKHRVKKGGSCTQNSKGEKTSKNDTKPFKSDAILSCPACMTTLCIDCQRHEIYKTQYRAMFVMNCEVCKDEILRYEDKKQKKKKCFKPGHLIAASEKDTARSELYNPVKCTECGTVTAVYDIDEVYHFFNILASQA